MLNSPSISVQGPAAVHETDIKVVIKRDTSPDVMPEPPRTCKKVYKTDSSIHSAITIVFFTAIYLLLNLPYGVMYVYVQVSSYRLGIPVYAVVKNSYIKSYAINIINILSLSINALLNPLLYYMRTKEFKEYVDAMLGRPTRSSRHVDISGVVISNAPTGSSPRMSKTKFYPVIKVDSNFSKNLGFKNVKETAA